MFHMKHRKESNVRTRVVTNNSWYMFVSCADQRTFKREVLRYGKEKEKDFPV